MARMAVKHAVAAAAQLACVLEVSAEKPGNITPRHDFADTSYEDMLRSAIALGPELAAAAERGVGDTVLAAVRATGRVAGANTNLGIALLLAPLARAALVGTGVAEVLRDLTLADAEAAYAAIREAGAGGLDAPVEHDVRDAPAVTLREAMAAAAERDSVAAEYARDFSLTLRARTAGARPRARRRAAGTRRRRGAVPRAAVRRPGHADRAQARPRCRRARVRRAAHVLAAGGVRSDAGRAAVAELDASLRAEGNALNPARRPTS